MTTETRTETRTRRTPLEKCRKLTEMIAETTGQDWTFGYIGNLEGNRDDRAWYAFRRIPGHVGTSADRIAGVSTEQLEILVPMLSGALKMARMLRP